MSELYLARCEHSWYGSASTFDRHPKTTRDISRERLNVFIQRLLDALLTGDILIRDQYNQRHGGF